MTPLITAGTWTLIVALLMLAFGLVAYRSIRKQMRNIDVPFQADANEGGILGGGRRGRETADPTRGELSDRAADAAEVEDLRG